jgi:protease-4
MNYTNTYTPPNNAANSAPAKQVVELKPKLGGFLASYILFSIPGFITALVWMIISVFILVGVVFAGSSNKSNPGEDKLSYSVLEKNTSTENAVLVYELNGAIQTGSKDLPDSSRSVGIYTEIVAKDFARIKADNNIKNVVFKVNTPGGAVFASEVLGDQISDLVKSKGQKQAVFYFDQVVASGGLWATFKNSDNYIVASNYGETGSIGVLLSVGNYKKLADNIGYSETVIKSAPNKDYGNPLRDLTTEEKAFLQKQVDDKYQQFINIVAKGRKLSPEKVKEFATGFVYENQQAKDFGLIDELGDVNKAVKKAASNSNLGDKYNVLEVKTESNPLDGIFAQSSVSKLIGISQSTTKILDKATLIQPGVVYAIDETKI